MFLNFRPQPWQNGTALLELREVNLVIRYYVTYTGDRACWLSSNIQHTTRRLKWNISNNIPVMDRDSLTPNLTKSIFARRFSKCSVWMADFDPARTSWVNLDYCYFNQAWRTRFSIMHGGIESRAARNRYGSNIPTHVACASIVISFDIVMSWDETS